VDRTGRFILAHGKAANLVPDPEERAFTARPTEDARTI
jgi:hypothetical protein